MSEEPGTSQERGTSPERGPDADTASLAYARRLQAKQRVWWKRWLNVQAPYQWNLRRQALGRTLDVGCGIGRNLETLGAGSVGVDHNPASVLIARERGVTALTTREWETSPLRQEGAYDGLLLAHVIEHMTHGEAEELLRAYLPYLRPGGQAFFVCPQERGYASDATHVELVDGPGLERLAVEVGLRPDPWFSFPFPRRFGRAYIYNEFCLRSVKPA